MTDDDPRRWWQTGVVYHVYPRAFMDASGDGMGDLEGVRQRLDHLVWLGVDALWLSPFYPSPGKDGGYDVSDYCAVDPALGTLEDLDRLIADAHARGLRVIVDWVPNHSSDQHAWFLDSRASRERPRRDWYVWRDAASGTGPGTGRPPTPPNNWLSAFGGPAWTWDGATEQFYLHSFLPEQPDLNWRSPALVGAMHDTLRFWMDRGVDGFRVDVAHHILKDPLFRDNPPEPNPDAGHKPVSDYDRQRHVHDRGHTDVHAAFCAIRRLVDGHTSSLGDRRERALVGETFLAHDLSAWASYFGTREAPELHLPMNFGLLGAPWTATGLRAHVEAIESAVPATGWPSYVLGSHDERRLTTRLAETGAGDDGARLAAVLLLTLRGTPTLYAGDEIGTPDRTVPRERQRDPAGIRTGVPGLGRDSGRTPMAWDHSPPACAGAGSAGFSTALPDALWLPLHAGHERINVEAQRADERSLLHLYRQLLALRRASPALHAGTYRTLGGTPNAVLAYERRAGSDRAVVGLNLSDREADVALPSDGAWRRAESSQPSDSHPAPDERLRPWEGVVWVDSASR